MAGDPVPGAATPAVTADGTADDTHATDAPAQPNGDAFVVPVGQQRQRKRRCSPAKIERQQRRRWYDRQDLGGTVRTPDSDGAQTGGDGRGRTLMEFALYGCPSFSALFRLCPLAV